MSKTKKRLTLGDILRSIPYLSPEQRNILRIHLKERQRRKAEMQKSLRESFGLWKDREDIPDGVEYVNALRSSWGRRLGRLGIDE